jgi:hypothetical protein
LFGQLLSFEDGDDQMLIRLLQHHHLIAGRRLCRLYRVNVPLARGSRAFALTSFSFAALHRALALSGRFLASYQGHFVVDERVFPAPPVVFADHEWPVFI